LLPLIKQGALIKGLAHITGGGLTENIPRVLPDGIGVLLDAKAWPFLHAFGWLKKFGKLTNDDMAVTYNCGLGMIAIVPANKADEICTAIQASGESAYVIGKTIQTDAEDRVVIANMDSAWAV
jgi:phosphoribosylaminoimidazole (AIR) synthetase